MKLLFIKKFFRLEFIRNFVPPSIINELKFIKCSTNFVSEIYSNSFQETPILSCISTTNSDICVSFNYNIERSFLQQLQKLPKSRACLFTVNGTFIRDYIEFEDLITSLAMTNLAEGTGINCLFLGLSSGVVK